MPSRIPREYRAPEMINHEAHDKIVDWWALGVLIYKMLFGKPPFQGEDKAELAANINSQELQFPQKTEDLTYSDSAKSLLEGLLAKPRFERLGDEN